MKPEELLTKANDEREDRGLHFICLNANISRQFEFVQSTWINNNKFSGLYNDADQLSGSNVSDFTIQQRPVSRHLKEVPAFVKVRGGGYFFMPSHDALRFLSEIPS
jgi:deferrochelatase/peroxidase EfeB